MLTYMYDTAALRQTGSRNLMCPKTLPTIWGTYMKLVTKYQISAINSCWEKCAYMFNVYKNQHSRNLTGPKMLPTIWYTYMMLVTKYQISAINSYWEKCDEKYLGRTEGQRSNSIPPSPFGERGYNDDFFYSIPLFYCRFLSCNWVIVCHNKWAEINCCFIMTV
jgi:hypothetical protein